MWQIFIYLSVSLSICPLLIRPGWLSLKPGFMGVRPGCLVLRPDWLCPRPGWPGLRSQAWLVRPKARTSLRGLPTGKPTKRKIDRQIDRHIDGPRLTENTDVAEWVHKWACQCFVSHNMLVTDRLWTAMRKHLVWLIWTALANKDLRRQGGALVVVRLPSSLPPPPH